jgi:hypothetical protein
MPADKTNFSFTIYLNHETYLHFISLIADATPVEWNDDKGFCARQNGRGQYVVFGTVDVINKGTISTGSAATTYKDKEKQTRDQNSKDTKASGRATTTNSAITNTNYDTKVALNIYTDQGSTYYAKSRNAFGNQIDSYSNALDYLVKRTPFGTKSR